MPVLSQTRGKGGQINRFGSYTLATQKSKVSSTYTHIPFHLGKEEILLQFKRCDPRIAWIERFGGPQLAPEPPDSNFSLSIYQRDCFLVGKENSFRAGPGRLSHLPLQNSSQPLHYFCQCNIPVTWRWRHWQHPHKKTFIFSPTVLMCFLLPLLAALGCFTYHYHQSSMSFGACFARRMFWTSGWRQIWHLTVFSCLFLFLLLQYLLQVVWKKLEITHI